MVNEPAGDGEGRRRRSYVSRAAARVVLPAVIALVLLGASAATASMHRPTGTTSGRSNAIAPTHPGVVGRLVTESASTPSGTIAENASTFVQGAIITFTYTASVATSTNWIGVYEPDQTPGVEDSTTWQYTPDSSGTVSFSTASLTPGTWVAYLFYDNGYGVMAGPISFSVTALPPAPPTTMPGYTGEEGGGLLEGPAGIALDSSGNSWVADSYADRVIELSPRGTVERVVGSRGSGPGQLNDPEAVAVDTDGQLFVADTGNDRVEEFSTTGRFLATIGGPGAGDGQFDQPEGVAVSGSFLYVADTSNNRVEEFSTADGAYTGEITAGMSAPQGLATDSTGDLWVAQNGIYDTSDDSVSEYSPAGDELLSFGADTSEFGGMSNPAGVAVDSAGDVYVTEPDYDLVQEFTQYGQYLGEFGTPVDGAAGTLDLPVGVAAEPDGQVLVADSGNNRIASFGPVGSRSTAASSAGDSTTGLSTTERLEPLEYPPVDVFGKQHPSAAWFKSSLALFASARKARNPR